MRHKQALAWLTASFAGAWLAAAQPAMAKDSLVIGVAQFPASMNPYISSQTVQYYTIGFGSRPVSAFDNDAKPVCLLCTELPTLENGLARIEDTPNGGKGLAVTIKLKPDLKWGDGVPVTARDLAFTWHVGANPDAGFSNNYAWSRATSVDVVDDHTAVLHLPRTLVTYQIWDYLLPEHIEGPVIASGGPPLDYINHTVYNAAPTTPGLWNGPYLVSTYRSGELVELTPNPHWPGPAPALKRIVVRLVDNTAALAANLLSGDVDMTPSGIGITTDQAVGLQHDHPEAFRFLYRPGLSYERIDLKAENPLLADKRVRQALLQAIDRKTLIARLFTGHATLAQAWINAIEPNFDPAMTFPPYDPANARKLLADAGFTPGPDGICRNPAGERLSLEFATTAGNRIRELSQVVMQNAWKAVCVEVVIRNQPARSFFGELARKRAFTGLVEYANSTRVGLVPTLFYASSAIPAAANNYNGNNWSGLSNPRLDAVLAQAETELDPAQQRALWAEMQRIYVDEMLELPLYFREDPDIVPTWLQGYEATGKEDYDSFWAERWH